MKTLRQVLVALVVTLLAIELLLQLASLVARPLLARESSRAGPSDAITILCVGDSHTYGAPLPDEESYPSQLQVLLDQRYGKGTFQVVNLGFPGVNSAFVANRLEAQIRQIRPQLVIASGGANNLWNSIESEAWQRQDLWSKIRSYLLRIKLYRLAAVTWSTQTEYHFKPGEEGSRWYHERPDGSAIGHEVGHMPEAGVTFERSEDRLPDDQLAHSVEVDMERIVTLAKGYGVPVIWYNYPWPRHFPAVLKTIDATGARLGIPVVRTELDYERALADGYTLPQLADMSAGLHPSKVLFGYIVQSMVPVILETLKEWDGIELQPLDPEAQPASIAGRAGSGS